ncbi:hypothetical protein NXV53_13160 [Bacteroides faecis]|jgi:hypothetical protein|uniref:hypothetical protein n=1 Tax=Bacteroides faecis TaxID=674529 RepID=UPI001C3FBF17|nr:hypothetical protein [Bacteroides faecis]MCS2576327.1 hypothetical protein [Bacteroides faecis]MCS3325520.1 hypothetical protein [Bacteroides faecis]DAY34001.1 MAG TPA: hypothetical protein [Caudoviricetes sp.]
MDEKFVSLDTLKSLTEQGFCYYHFPTQSFAQKWLRETKNMHIAIIRNACGYGYDICKADNGTHIADGVFDGPNDGGQWDTYEEALEAGMQKALKITEV